MGFVFFVCIGVDVGSIPSSTRQVFALLRLEVEAKDHEELEGVKEDQYNVNDHIAIIEPAETAPQYDAGKYVANPREHSNYDHLYDCDKEVHSKDYFQVRL